MFYVYLGLLVVAADQLTKYFIQSKMSPYESIAVLNGWFSITYVENPGAAFGIFPSQTLLLVCLSLFVFFIAWRNRRQLENFPPIFRVGIALALGGSLGNFLDRVRLKHVVDFFDFHFWPVFNVADMGIVCGIGLIVLGIFREKIELRSKRPSEGASEEEHS